MDCNLQNVHGVLAAQTMHTSTCVMCIVVAAACSSPDDVPDEQRQPHGADHSHGQQRHAAHASLPVALAVWLHFARSSFPSLSQSLPADAVQQHGWRICAPLKHIVGHAIGVQNDRLPLLLVVVVVVAAAAAVEVVLLPWLQRLLWGGVQH